MKSQSVIVSTFAATLHQLNASECCCMQYNHTLDLGKLDQAASTGENRRAIEKWLNNMISAECSELKGWVCDSLHGDCLDDS